MLHVHHAASSASLLAALAEVLSTPPADVLAREQVAVHSRGFERWLAQGLSHHLGASPAGDDGIAMGIEFPFPGRLIADVLAAADDVEVPDPWRLDRLTWHLLALVEDEPTLTRDTPLQRLVHRDRSARLGGVRRLADRFDRYGVHRPELLRAWAADPELPADHARPTTADGHVLPERLAWQARLWRALRDHLVASTGVASPAERLPGLLDTLSSRPDRLALPERLALFGLTALPAGHLDVLIALAHHREVHLLLAHPSPVVWHRCAEQLRDHGRIGAPIPTREDDPTRDAARHPLTRTWARDAREMTVVLASRGIDPAGSHLAGEPVRPDRPSPRAAGEQLSLDGLVDTDDPDASTGEDHGSPTLLARLQAAIHRDEAPPGRPPLGDDLRPLLADRDASVGFHAAHGLRRQVEIVRDLLLHRFAADPGLQPRDVVVMGPDVDALAPIVEAVFARGVPRAGVADTAPDADRTDVDDRLQPGDLRVRVADRTVARTNPLLEVATTLLDAGHTRFAVSEVLDLIERAPVRARFELDDADLERIGRWVDGLAIRWGLDGAHRATLDVPTEAGTWASGLERLLLGVTTADEDRRTVAGIVPYDDVADDDVDLLGRLGELIVRLDAAYRSLQTDRPLEGWIDTLRTALDALTHTGGAPWMRLQVEQALDDARRAAGPIGRRVPLAAREVRDLLVAQVSGTSGRADQRTGDLTVCGLVPMRAVPHRVVCVVGLDDGAFPRRGGTDGDDVLERDERVGDRDPRTEDRQLLLDAVLAAGDTLIVTYSGHDERSGDVRPPAVPVRELVDVLDATARTSDGTGAGTARSFEHPLHAFDPSNFDLHGPVGLPAPLGSDPHEFAAASALAAADRPRPQPPFGDPLAPVHLVAHDAPIEAADAALGLDPDARIVELDALQDLLHAPLAGFLQARLGLVHPRRRQLAGDELAIELTGLEDHAVGQQLLDERLAGSDLDRAVMLLTARGGLPPGELAGPGLTRVGTILDRLLEAAEANGVLGAADDAYPVDLALPGGMRLVGSVDELVGGVVRRLRYTRLRPSHRLAGWIALLALTASEPERPWASVTIGRIASSSKERNKRPLFVTAARAHVPGEQPTERAAWARHQLTVLIALARTSLRRPVPLLTDTSAHLAASRHVERTVARSRADWRTAPRHAWEDGGARGAEREAPAWALIGASQPSFAELLTVPGTITGLPIAPAAPPVGEVEPSATDEVDARPVRDRVPSHWADPLGEPDEGAGSLVRELADLVWRPMLEHSVVVER